MLPSPVHVFGPYAGLEEVKRVQRTEFRLTLDRLKGDRSLPGFWTRGKVLSERELEEQTRQLELLVVSSFKFALQPVRFKTDSTVH